MNVLNKENCCKVSGAIRNTYTCEFIDMKDYSVPSYNPPIESKIDYSLMAILVGNAAAFGCLNGARTGGMYGCVAGGAYAGTGTMYAMIFADSYNMYQANKK